jgi:hypothetical protein
VISKPCAEAGNNITYTQNRPRTGLSSGVTHDNDNKCFGIADFLSLYLEAGGALYLMKATVDARDENGLPNSGAMTSEGND